MLFIFYVSESMDLKIFEDETKFIYYNKLKSKYFELHAYPLKRTYIVNKKYETRKGFLLYLIFFLIKLGP